MAGNKAFDLDLAYGLSRESAFLDILNADKVEVKSDRRAATTGNFFVEIESRGKASGIMTTEAQWWVQEIAELGVFMMFPTEWFKRLVLTTMEKRGTIRGGDGNTSVGVLVKVTDCVKEIKE